MGNINIAYSLGIGTCTNTTNLKVIFSDFNDFIHSYFSTDLFSHSTDQRNVECIDQAWIILGWVTNSPFKTFKVGIM